MPPLTRAKRTSAGRSRKAMPPAKKRDGPDRILYGYDCLDVLNDDLALPAGSVDLIYLDPPFNSKGHYNLPFKGKDKDARPVEAFIDTWTWGTKEDELLRELSGGPQSRYLADIIRLADGIERGGGQRSPFSLAAYLLNMATRLMAMRRVLSPTGTIYLHCDPTASHYLKLVMDAIFGMDHFRNEIVWNYRRWPAKTPQWQKMHDTIFWYSKGQQWTWNQQYEPLAASTLKADGGKRILNVFDENGRRRRGQKTGEDSPGAPMRAVWDIGFISPTARERLGYPTQKPLALLERIIKASSNPGDLVLDPFCGCGTAVHAAERLDRRWVGIDISAFSVGLMRNRVLNAFAELTTDDVLVHGVPISVADAEELAARDKFEFEKWVCGAIGAEGLFHPPGTPGPDQGVDGVLPFVPIRFGRKMKPEFAIVQVKGGDVVVNDVKALETTVRRMDATAGVFVCFDRHMGTVENQRGNATFRDDLGTYPVIQGYSVEDLLSNKPLDLPIHKGVAERMPASEWTSLQAELVKA